ncbi:MAG: TonB-dependent receptor, partial [Acidobacteria bacterium]
MNWNLSVQRVFAKDYTVEARYLGNRGVHLLFQRQINRIAIATANHNLPVFFQAPSQATLDGLTLTHAQLINERNSFGNIMAPAGFTSNITAYEPLGNSKYHGLAAEVNKRFTARTLFKAAYTWSHLTDDSTAEVFSTVLSPRRPEDFFNIRKEWASSALDHRHRFSFSWVYQVPWFANASSVLRNVVGNWQFSGTYAVESPEFATPQSNADANLNGDAAADRTIVNTSGHPGTGSDVTPVCNSVLLAGRTCSLTASSNAVVGYLVNDPTAYYVRAQV